MLECVVNISEGRDPARLRALRLLGGRALLDLHADPDHHRCVLTLAGPDDALLTTVIKHHAVRRIAEREDFLQVF